MAYNLAKLISDIKQTFTKQALQLGRLDKVTPPQNQAITLLSIDLSNAIDDYVKNGEFVLSFATAYAIPNGSRTYWLKSTGGEVYSLYDTVESNSPSDANTIISAVNYSRTISVTTAGSGVMDARIFLDRGTNDWFMVSRALTYNTAYAIIPANTRAALSMLNGGSVAVQANISILKAGKTS